MVRAVLRAASGAVEGAPAAKAATASGSALPRAVSACVGTWTEDGRRAGPAGAVPAQGWGTQPGDGKMAGKGVGAAWAAQLAALRPHPNHPAQPELLASPSCWPTQIAAQSSPCCQP